MVKKFSDLVNPALNDDSLSLGIGLFYCYEKVVELKYEFIFYILYDFLAHFILFTYSYFSFLEHCTATIPRFIDYFSSNRNFLVDLMFYI